MVIPPVCMNSAHRAAFVADGPQQVAELINANCPGEIYFTGSGTEADNLAIKGIVLNAEGTPYHHFRR